MPIPNDFTDFTSGNSRRFRFRGTKPSRLVPTPVYVQVQMNTEGTGLLATIGEHWNVPVLRLLDPDDKAIKLYPAEYFEEVTE